MYLIKKCFCVFWHELVRDRICRRCKKILKKKITFTNIFKQKCVSTNPVQKILIPTNSLVLPAGVSVSWWSSRMYGISSIRRNTESLGLFWPSDLLPAGKKTRSHHNQYCLTRKQSPGSDWSGGLTDNAVFLIEQRSAVRDAALVSSGIAGRAGSTGLSGRWHEAGGGVRR